MIVLPFGIATPKLVSVNEQPMPKITSDFVEEVVHRLRHGVAARAERQRMVLGERALAAEAGGDRDGQQLGELACSSAQASA